MSKRWRQGDEGETRGGWPPFPAPDGTYTLFLSAKQKKPRNKAKQ